MVNGDRICLSTGIGRTLNFSACSFKCSRKRRIFCHLLCHRLLLLSCASWSSLAKSSRNTKTTYASKGLYVLYWRSSWIIIFPLPHLYAFALLLDPRCRLKGLKKFLRLLEKLLGKYYTTLAKGHKNALQEAYKQYELQFGGTSDQGDWAYVAAFSELEDDSLTGSERGGVAWAPEKYPNITSSTCFWIPNSQTLVMTTWIWSSGGRIIQPNFWCYVRWLVRSSRFPCLLSHQNLHLTWSAIY